MSGSFSFFLHIVGVGLVFIVVVGGWALNWKLSAEKEVPLKLYVGGLLRSVGLLSPFVALLLLITGIGNMHNRYTGTELSWYSEGWLVAKIIFFAMFVVNGTVFGVILGRKRTHLLKNIVEQKAPTDADKTLKSLNRQITLFYAVQFVLLMIILLLSTFGSGKHPGSI